MCVLSLITLQNTLMESALPCSFFHILDGAEHQAGCRGAWNGLIENTVPRTTWHRSILRNPVQTPQVSAEKPAFPELWGFVLLYFTQCTKFRPKQCSGHVMAGPSLGAPGKGGSCGCVVTMRKGASWARGRQFIWLNHKPEESKVRR